MVSITFYFLEGILCACVCMCVLVNPTLYGQKVPTKINKPTKLCLFEKWIGWGIENTAFKV